MKITRNTWMLVILLFVGSLAIATVYLYTTLHFPSADLASNARKDVVLPGSLKLSSSLQTTNFLVGQDVYIVVSASSQDVPISAYDAVVKYDPTILHFEDAQNAQEEYDMFTNDKTGTVSITGGLKLSAVPSAVSDGILATLHFTVLKPGQTPVTLVFTPGSKTDSNLLSAKAEDILDHVEGLTIRVGDKIVISKTQPTRVADKTFTLLESRLSPQTCADCESVARISVEENGQTHVLEYVNGGFEGKVAREKTLGNQVYQLEDMQEDSVTLIVVNK